MFRSFQNCNRKIYISYILPVKSRLHKMLSPCTRYSRHKCLKSSKDLPTKERTGKNHSISKEEKEETYMLCFAVIFNEELTYVDLKFVQNNDDAPTPDPELIHHREVSS